MNWCRELRGKVLFNEPLARHTSFGIGPVAKSWFEPYDLEDLKALLKRIKLNKIEYLIIGLGSKLLIKKKRIPMAIHLGSGYFKRISVNGNIASAGAGVGLSYLIKSLGQIGFGGLEFLSGIPASLGGALVMNAAVAWPSVRAIGGLVESVEVMDKNGRLKVFGKKSLSFAYRHSGLDKFIITAVNLKVEKKKRPNIDREISRFLDYRHRTQDVGGLSAGCVFKNPHPWSAGKLIDSCGLKGRRIGDAMISRKHANFIVNQGKASAKDVLDLMKLMQRCVRKKFQVDLEPEIRVI